MIILGIDPGTATTGYGVVRCGEKNHYQVIESGWISTSKDDERDKRLLSTFKQTRAIIKKHRPNVIALERIFFSLNVRTAMSVAESGGVIKLASAIEKVPFTEYTPLTVKMAVTGKGKADKKLVKKTVRKLLNVRSPKKKKTHFDDVTDALALAICHWQHCHDKIKTGKRGG
jgi:crossover junction endodeoxyribonuclease RuvC